MEKSHVKISIVKFADWTVCPGVKALASEKATFSIK